MSRSTSSPLDVIDAHFQRLIRTNSRLGIDGRTLHDDLPQRFIPANELRAILLHPSVSHEARDAALRFVFEKARTNDQWTVVLLGLFIPGLKRAGARLGRGMAAQRNDIDVEMIAGILNRLREGGVESHFAAKLMTAAISQGRLFIRGEQRVEKMLDRLHEVDGPLDEMQRVLDRAVAIGVLDADEAELIAQTRIFGDRIADLARAMGMDQGTLRRRRNRAEAKLRPFLHHPGLGDA